MEFLFNLEKGGNWTLEVIYFFKHILFHLYSPNLRPEQLWKLLVYSKFLVENLKLL